MPDPCKEFYSVLPNLSMPLCQKAQLRPSSAKSVKGRPLYLRDIGDPQAPLRVLVIGAMHGDELSSASMVFHWLSMAESDSQNILWRFAPAVNPDGLLGKPAKRTNANGVDLNRNFPTPRWEVESVRYWQITTKRDSRRWPGKTSLSEPESKFVYQQIDHFKPHLVVSIHAPYGVLDFDGSVLPPAQLGRLYLDQVGVFPGSLGNYSGIHKGIPVVTVELPAAQATPRNVEIRKMWDDLNTWIKRKIVDSHEANSAKVAPFKDAGNPTN
jgi:hypothetical protein